jgi:hypothetical protein
MPENGGFKPLEYADFAELEKLGSTKRRPIRFTSESRAELNECLRRNCGPEGDKLVSKHHKAAAQMRASIARDARSLLTTLRAMDAATEPGTRWAAWKLFPADRKRQFGVVSITGEMLGHGWSMRELIARLEALRRWAEYQAPALEAVSKKGRAADLWLDWFIIVVSDAFDSAGGIVSATHTMKRQKLVRESPFLRVLRFIHRRLPAERQAESESALDARAARSDWREWTAYRDRGRRIRKRR